MLRAVSRQVASTQESRRPRRSFIVPQQVKDWIGLNLSDRYEVKKLLGEGGMGFVYLGYDRKLKSAVVIKAPRQHLLHEAGFIERFDAEVSSLVNLAHPHIVKVSDVGKHDDIPFAVMQHLAGGSLEDIAPRDSGTGLSKQLPLEAITKWLPFVAEALDFIHARGYVHRDIKPGNILFDADKNVYLSDFGVAKAIADQNDVNVGRNLTATGHVMGTPDYMAPELLTGGQLGGSVDQYALAVMTHELICGSMPFSGPTPAAVFVKHVTDQPPAIHTICDTVPEGVSRVVLKALSKSPGERFTSCCEFSDALIKEALLKNVTLHCLVCGAEISENVSKDGETVVCPRCGNIATNSLAHYERTHEQERQEPESGPSGGNSLESQVHADTQANAQLDTAAFATNVPSQPLSKQQAHSRIRTVSITLIAVCLVISLGGALFYWASLPPDWELIFRDEVPLNQQMASIEQNIQSMADSSASSQSVLIQLHYVDSDGLRKEWDSYTGRRKKEFANQVDAISRSHESLSIAVGNFSTEIDTRQASFTERGGLPSDAALVKDQSTLDSYQDRLDTIRQTLQEFSADFPLEIIKQEKVVRTEIEALETIESAWDSWAPLKLSRGTLLRAKHFASTSVSKPLRIKSLSVLLQSPGGKSVSDRQASNALRMVKGQLETSRSQVPEDQEWMTKLCYRLLLAGKHYSSTLDLLSSSDLLQHIPGPLRIPLVEQRPEEWRKQDFFSKVVTLCKDESERFRLYAVQCRYQDEQWVPEIRSAIEKGLLYKRRHAAAKMIMQSRWTQLYDIPLAFTQEKSYPLDTLDPSFLDHLASVKPAYAETLSRTLLGNPKFLHPKWAMESYLPSGGKVELFKLLQTPKRIGMALSTLFEINSNASFAMAKDVIVADYKGEISIDYQNFDFTTVARDLPTNHKKLNRQLLISAWKSGVPTAQQWVAARILPPETIKFIVSIESQAAEHNQLRSTLSETFNDTNKQSKPSSRSPFRGSKLLSFPNNQRNLAQLRNGVYTSRRSFGTSRRGQTRSPQSGVGNAPLVFDDLKSELDKHQKLLKLAEDENRDFQYFSGLKEKIAALKGYLESHKNFAAVHTAFANICGKLNAKAYGSRIYMEADDYERLKRIAKKHKDSYAPLLELSSQLEWVRN